MPSARRSISPFGCAALWIILAFAASAVSARAETPASVDMEAVRAALRQATTYHLGDSRAFFNPVLEAARAVSGGDSARRAEFAEALAAFLDGDATPEAKDMVCRVLAPIAGAAQAPSLLRLLDDPALFSNALLALRAVPGEGVESALIEVLGRETDPERQRALVVALGERRCVAALPLFTDLARSDTASLAEAALRALMHLESDDAFAAIASLRDEITAADPAVFEEARLRRAELLLDRGDTASALALCEAVLKEAAPHQRVAAAILRLRALGNQAAEAVGGALSGEDAALRLAALSFIGACDAQAADRLLDAAAHWPEQAQLALVLALERDFPRRALDRAIALTHAGDPAIAEAAQALVGRLDPYEMIKVLAAEAATSEGAAARQRLDVLRSEDLPGNRGDHRIEAIYLDLSAQLPPIQGAELIGSVARRAARIQHDEVLADFLRRAADETLAGPLRAACFQAIALLGGGKELSAAIPWLLSPGARDSREALEQCIAALALRASAQEMDEAIALIPVEGLSAESLASALRVLGQFNNPAARARMMDICLRGDAESGMAAARALAQSPHDEALDSLLQLAREGQSIPQRVVAFRGAMRLMARRSAAPQDMAELLAQALDAAPRAEERQSVLAQIVLLKDLATLPLLFRCIEEPGLAAEAQRALTALLLAHATPAASTATDAAGLAMDADPASAWRAEGATAPAWFSVHFPADIALREVVFLGVFPGSEDDWTISTAAAGQPWEARSARIRRVEQGIVATLDMPLRCRGVLLQANGPDLEGWTISGIAFSHPAMQGFGLAAPRE